MKFTGRTVGAVASGAYILQGGGGMGRAEKRAVDPRSSSTDNNAPVDYSRFLDPSYWDDSADDSDSGGSGVTTPSASPGAGAGTVHVGAAETLPRALVLSGACPSGISPRPATAAVRGRVNIDKYLNPDDWVDESDSEGSSTKQSPGRHAPSPPKKRLPVVELGAGEDRGAEPTASACSVRHILSEEFWHESDDSEDDEDDGCGQGTGLPRRDELAKHISVILGRMMARQGQVRRASVAAGGGCGMEPGGDRRKAGAANLREMQAELTDGVAALLKFYHQTHQVPRPASSRPRSRVSTPAPGESVSEAGRPGGPACVPDPAPLPVAPPAPRVPTTPLPAIPAPSSDQAAAMPQGGTDIGPEGGAEAAMDVRQFATEEVCEICFGSVSEETRFGDNGCCDSVFCKGCMSIYVSVQSNEGRANNITCAGCREPLRFEVLEGALDEDDLQKLQYLQNLYDNLNNRACPSCGHVQTGSKASPRMVCGECGAQYCFLHADAHTGSTCRAYEKRIRRQERQFRRWSSQNARHCPKCGATIEKADSDSCNHMTCRCGYNFCWLCGRKYVPENCTSPFLSHFGRFNPFGCPGMQFVTEHATRKKWQRRAVILGLAPILAATGPGLIIKHQLNKRRLAAMERRFMEQRRRSHMMDETEGGRWSDDTASSVNLDDNGDSAPRPQVHLHRSSI